MNFILGLLLPDVCPAVPSALQSRSPRRICARPPDRWDRCFSSGRETRVATRVPAAASSVVRWTKGSGLSPSSRQRAWHAATSARVPIGRPVLGTRGGRFDVQTPTVLTGFAVATGIPRAPHLPARAEVMTIALEIGAAFLLAATLVAG